MEELENLLTEWKEKHIKAGYKNFIKDGIVDEDWWSNEQIVPKICYFLKEGRTEESDYNLVEDLNRRGPWNTWKKVAIWTQAIQSVYTGEKAYNEKSIKENERNLTNQIAVVNVKKSNGLANSEDSDLQVYADQDKAELKKELEIISPDVIVCGSTFWLLERILGEELDIRHIYDTWYGFWNDTLIINYYHPACYYANRLNYYALMSICRLALKEGHENKRKVNNKA